MASKLPKTRVTRRNTKKTISVDDTARTFVKNSIDPSFITKIWIDGYIGYGVFAGRRILNSEFIAEYCGELVSHEEGQRLYSCLDENQERCYLYFFEHGVKKYCVDGSNFNNRIGRYINDSKRANCRVKVLEVNGKPHLCIFAITDIPENTELRYDYKEKGLPWRIDKKYSKPFSIYDLDSLRQEDQINASESCDTKEPLDFDSKLKEFQESKIDLEITRSELAAWKAVIDKNPISLEEPVIEEVPDDESDGELTEERMDEIDEVFGFKMSTKDIIKKHEEMNVSKKQPDNKPSVYTINLTDDDDDGIIKDVISDVLDAVTLVCDVPVTQLVELLANGEDDVYQHKEMTDFLLEQQLVDKKSVYSINTDDNDDDIIRDVETVISNVIETVISSCVVPVALQEELLLKGEFGAYQNCFNCKKDATTHQCHLSKCGDDSWLCRECLEDHVCLRKDNSSDPCHDIEAANECSQRVDVEELMADMIRVYQIYGKNYVNVKINDDQSVTAERSKNVIVDQPTTGNIDLVNASCGKSLEPTYAKQYCRNKVKCPEKGCKAEIINLPRHLRNVHKTSRKRARKARGIHNLRKDRSDKLSEKKKNYVPYICPICNVVSKRIHDHLYKSPHYLKHNMELYREMLEQKIPYDEGYIKIKLPGIKSKPVFSKKDYLKVENESKESECDSAVSESAESSYESDSDGEDGVEQSPGGFCAPEWDEYLKVFENYLKSHSGGKKDASNARNERNQMRRMMEVICEGEPSYALLCDLPKINDIWLVKHTKQKKFEPGTIRSYLLTLDHFIDFIIRSKITPNVPNVMPVDLDVETMRVCKREIANWRAALRPEEEEREFVVMMEDGDNIIPKEEFQEVLKSDFYIRVIESIDRIQKKSASIRVIITRDIFVNSRDSLFFNLIVNNISRSGGVANMTIDEYNRGKYSPTGQYVVLVKKHKTSRKYGPCQITIKEDIKRYCDVYLAIIRNGVPGRKADNFFMSWSGLPLKSGAVSTQLHSFFLKCFPEGQKERTKNISATLIRKSLLTFFYDTMPEMNVELGNLMKHDPKTGSRSYHLTRLRKECSATSQKVHEAIYQSNSKRKSEESMDAVSPKAAKLVVPANENFHCDAEIQKAANSVEPASETSDPEWESQHRDETSLLQKRHIWTIEEVELLTSLFGREDSHYNWSLGHIKELLSERADLKHLTSKQVYDKLRQLHQSGHFKGDDANNNEKDVKKKIQFTDSANVKIKQLFKKHIRRSGMITSKLVMDVINASESNKELFNDYSSSQLVAKVRYERQQFRLSRR